MFTNANVVPVTGITNLHVNDIDTNRKSGAGLSAYEITPQVAGNHARIVQLVSRLRW